MRVNENYDFDCLDTNYIQLNIMNTKGEIYVVNLSEDTTVETLKNKILSYLRSHTTSHWDSGNLISFRLISTMQKRSLQDSRTLKEEQVMNNDYLIMKKKKATSGANCDKGYSTITKQQIAEATRSVPSRNLDERAGAFHMQNSQSNFCKDIRKALIVLVDYSEKLLRDHPKVRRIFSLSNELGSQEDLNFLKEDEMDEDALAKLTDMGFTDVEKSRQALKLNNNNTVDAINWLLAQSEDGNAGSCKAHLQSSSELCQSANSLPSELNEFEVDKSKTPTFNHQTFFDKNEVYENVPKLVESFRRYKRNNFYYNKRSFENMRRMGFNDREVKDSLWIMNNNENLACEWLLSNRRPKLEELNIGLMRGSPLYNSLLKNPIIQLGLLKPKVLFAFLHLLSSNFFNGEPNANRWLNEPEISPIITQVVRLYHSEKPNHLQATAFISQPPMGHQPHQQQAPQPRTCFANQARTSFDSSNYSSTSYSSANYNANYSSVNYTNANSDYSTFVIPEILNNLSLSDNQERPEPDAWTLAERNNHVTLV